MLNCSTIPYMAIITFIMQSNGGQYEHVLIDGASIFGSNISTPKALIIRVFVWYINVKSCRHTKAICFGLLRKSTN